MTTIKNQNGKKTISYHIKGSEAEYVAQLRAIAAATASTDIGEDNRQALGGMLQQILPTESQVNLSKK